MSLFAGIFKQQGSTAPAVSSLFANTSKYRRPGADGLFPAPAEVPTAAGNNPQQASRPDRKDKKDKKRKRDATGDIADTQQQGAGAKPSILPAAHGEAQAMQTRKHQQDKQGKAASAPAAVPAGQQQAAGKRKQPASAPSAPAVAHASTPQPEQDHPVHESLVGGPINLEGNDQDQPAARRKRAKLAKERKRLKGEAAARGGPVGNAAPTAEGQRGGPSSAEQSAAAGVNAAELGGGAHEAQAQAKLSATEEAERLQRTVFVGNLPVAVKKKALTKLFAQYGKVESVRLRSVAIKPDLKMPRKSAILSGNLSETRGVANAYIVFDTPEAVDAALALNMQELGGLHMRVDRAAKKSKEAGSSGVEYDRSHSVFVGNLPFDIEDEELIRLFKTRSDELGMADAVAAVRVVRDGHTNLGKGFAFVLLKTKDAARAALSLDGQELHGRPIRVTRVQAGPKGPKQPKQKPAKAASQAHAGPSSHQQPGGFADRRKRPAPENDDWRGMRTKGRSKLVVGSAGKAVVQRSGGHGAAGPSSGAKAGRLGPKPLEKKRKAAGKRPAVLARKAAAKGAPSPGKPKAKKQKAGK